MFSNNAFEFSDNDHYIHNNASENGYVKKTKQRDPSTKESQLQNGFLQPSTNPKNKKKRKSSEIYKATSEGLISVLRSLIIGDASLVHECDEEGFYPLHIAAKYNRAQVVSILLDFGAECNMVSSSNGLTALHMASRFNSVDAARVLLDRGANPNFQSPSNGQSPLHVCGRFNSVDVMKLLLSKANIELDIKDCISATPLHIASSYGNLEPTKLLIFHGASIDASAVEDFRVLHTAVYGSNIRVISAVIDSAIQRYFKSPVNVFSSSSSTTNTKFQNFIDAKSESGDTALHIAVKQGCFEIIKLLIQHNASVNAVNNSNQTPLHFAAMCGGGETVELLLTKQAKTNCQDVDMKTPLHYAASIGNSEAVKHLWNQGASVDVKDINKLTPLLYAITAGQFECVCLLVNYGADILMLDNNGRSCLHLAVENEHDDLVSFLLEKKKGKQLIDKYEPEKERTPLHYAALTGNVKIVELLLKHKPTTARKDIHRKTALHLATEVGKNRVVELLARAGITAVFDRDDMLRTPLHYAAMGKRRKLCANLLRFGAEVDSQDANRWTPLMWAVKSGDMDTTSLLLENKAQLGCVDNKGNTLLHVACYNNQVEIAKLLLDSGIDITLNNNQMNCLDCAVEQQQCDVVMAIVKHSRWEEIFRVHCHGLQNPMTTLIQTFPEAAEVVMDRCVQRSLSVKRKSTKVVTSYNFRYLDPGPDDVSGPEGERYLGLIDMVQFKRQDLLTHPLARKLLSLKWRKFGRLIYFFNIFIYSVFLMMLTGFIMTERNHVSVKTLQNRSASRDMDVVYDERDNDRRIVPMTILAFSGFHLLKELYQMYLLRGRYFMDIANFMEWCLYLSSLTFVFPFVMKDETLAVENYKIFWQIGAISVFMGFGNFILFLRVLSHVGLYVTMYIEVVKTLMKVMCLFMVFILNFAVVFYILFKEEAAFADFFKSIVKTTVMTVGELDYATLLVDGLNQKNDETGEQYVPFPDLSFIFFYIFLLAMPIVLMNLLIGLAVGDIDAIQQTAFLSNKKMRIDFVSEVERKFPLFITHRLYKAELTVHNTRRKMKSFSRTSNAQLLVDDEDVGEETDIREDPSTIQFREVKQELSKTRQQMKALSGRMEKQQELLIALAKKNGITVGGPPKDNRRIVKLF